MPADPTAEIKGVYNLVEEHFPIYESKVETQSITFYVEPKNRAVVGEEFGQLQKALKAQGFIAVFNYTGGEYIIQVVRNPVQQTSKPKKTIVNKVLLLLTFITTTLAGMMLWSSYDSTEMWSLTTAGMGALTFAVPLMAILGIHELGHYYAAKRHGLNASLPYFIPSIPPFGTFGAFISLREPMPDRKTLVDVGAAGSAVRLSGYHSRCHCRFVSNRSGRSCGRRCYCGSSLHHHPADLSADGLLSAVSRRHGYAPDGLRRLGGFLCYRHQSLTHRPTRRAVILPGVCWEKTPNT